MKVWLQDLMKKLIMHLLFQTINNKFNLLSKL